MNAVVCSVNISLNKGEKKKPVEEVVFLEGRGIKNDGHCDSPVRQVSLLDSLSIEKITAKGIGVAPGDFAENITTEHLDTLQIKIGDTIYVGNDVILEVTQIGKECHEGCEIFRQVGDCVMPREGIFAKVLKGGSARKGDSIKLEKE